MPKKHPISDRPARGTAISDGISPIQELTGQVKEVEQSVRRFGLVLQKYYRKTDSPRRRYNALETLLLDFTAQLQYEINNPKRKTMRELAKEHGWKPFSDEVFRENMRSLSAKRPL